MALLCNEALHNCPGLTPIKLALRFPWDWDYNQSPLKKYHGGYLNKMELCQKGGNGGEREEWVIDWESIVSTVRCHD